VRAAAAIVAALAALALAVAAPAAGGTSARAADARLALSDAQAALVFGDRAEARSAVLRAGALLDTALARSAEARARVAAAIGAGAAAAARGDEVGLAAAAASAWTTALRVSAVEAVAAARRGAVDASREWLLVREFRPPTRFTRAAADATMALDRLAAGRTAPRAAAASVRNDLLDTYDARLRIALAAAADADRVGFDVRRAEAAAQARGYWQIVLPAYASQRGAAAARTASRRFDAFVAPGGRFAAELRAVERALEGFRAAPLAPAEQLRRAGQLERFLKLVPIEYGRGVDDGRVTASFEIQEAITFRDGAAGAFRDLEPVLLANDRPATRSLGVTLTQLGAALAAASREDKVADPEHVAAVTDKALGLIDELYPASWKDAAKTADFDVIAATLDRLQAAAEAGEWGRAESARLEAYGVFELGPEQRLRGLAPSLFRQIEGLFWYGDGGNDGLVQLLKRKAATAEIATTRAALDTSLSEAQSRIGAGPQSSLSIVTNSAIIVFREGLEAVLILAALSASLVGAQRRFRRPLLLGVGLALVASGITWVVAQTVLGSLAGFGERLEAVVSLVAIAVLLLVLNWFYHRVYWQENLQDLHRRKRSVLAGAGVSLAAAQVLGLVALGFSSVYREGFETVLFLQALTLEAGAWTVLQGVALGLAATLAVGVLVVALERKLPHKKMLALTGLLITGVLVVLVGGTVQTLQVVGWVPVTPVEGLTLPYWSGLWLGLYPTWEGLVAQAAAAAFVLGSYVAAESLRSRRRAKILAPAVKARSL
jgi:high-affinity iron transporter